MQRYEFRAGTAINMKLKHLAIEISRLNGFNNPKIELEQYITPGDLAARWILTTARLGDLEQGSKVLDLGCGTGVLGLGALIFGASSATMVDVDDDAIDIMLENARSLGVEGKVVPMCEEITNVGNIEADLVLCNPPWGKQKQGADSNFIESIKSLCLPTYILHSSSAKHLEAEFLRSSWHVQKLLSSPFDLGAIYPHHTKRRMSTDATLWRLTPP